MWEDEGAASRGEEACRPQIWADRVALSSTSEGLRADLEWTSLEKREPVPSKELDKRLTALRLLSGLMSVRQVSQGSSTEPSRAF